MTGSNIVLYAVDNGVRRVLGSVTPGQNGAAIYMQQAANECFRDARGRGIPFPELRAVLESREGDSPAKMHDEKFVEVDVATLAALKDAKTFMTLDELFAPKKGA